MRRKESPLREIEHPSNLCTLAECVQQGGSSYGGRARMGTSTGHPGILPGSTAPVAVGYKYGTSGSILLGVVAVLGCKEALPMSPDGRSPALGQHHLAGHRAPSSTSTARRWHDRHRETKCHSLPHPHRPLSISVYCSSIQALQSFLEESQQTNHHFFPFFDKWRG